MRADQTLSPSADTAAQLRVFRERMAAFIAMFIVVGSFTLIGWSMSLVNSSADFALAKDLLLFINPILGVCIGYFFNKVTSDARAESAESAAGCAEDMLGHVNGRGPRAEADPARPDERLRAQIRLASSLDRAMKLMKR